MMMISAVVVSGLDTCGSSSCASLRMWYREREVMARSHAGAFMAPSEQWMVVSLNLPVNASLMISMSMSPMSFLSTRNEGAVLKEGEGEGGVKAEGEGGVTAEGEGGVAAEGEGGVTAEGGTVEEECTGVLVMVGTKSSVPKVANTPAVLVTGAVAEETARRQ